MEARYNIMSNFVITKNTNPDSSTPVYDIQGASGLVTYKRFGAIGASAYIRNKDFHNYALL